MSQFEPVTTLLNSEVIDGQGEFVGWLQEILIDSSVGKIEYATISLATDDDSSKRVIVPWSAVRREQNLTPRWRVAARLSTLRKLACEPRDAALSKAETPDH